MININFFATKQSKKERQKKQDIQLFKISTYFLAATIVFAVGMSGFRLFINWQTQQLDKQIATYKASILAKENVEVSYLIYVNKIKAISEIYESRSDKQDAMNYFTDSFQNLADITGMNYEVKEGGLTLQLSNDTVFKLEKSLALLDSDEIKNHYKSISRNILSRSENGSYRLTIKLGLKNDPITPTPTPESTQDSQDTL